MCRKVLWLFLILFFWAGVNVIAQETHCMPFIESLRLRDGPSLESKTIRLLARFELLTILETGGDQVIDQTRGRWIKVQTGRSEIGYCFNADCLSADPVVSGEPD